jgi:regulatory protein YycH of two-component signal transduction system YycFG
MKLETIKTFILIILIGTSLLLTFGLWTYQPNDNELDNVELVNEVNIGGTEESRNTMMQPNTIIFHSADQHLGFGDPAHQHALFEKLQNWEMNGLHVRETETDRMQEDDEVELQFPVEIPMEMVPRIFTMDEDAEEMPSWSFDRMFITFDQDALTLQITFQSIDGRRMADTVITNSEHYDELWSEVTEQEHVIEFLMIDEGDRPVYFPEEPMEMTQHSLSVTHVSPDMLVSALFPSPSVVSRSISPDRNLGGSYYTDGVREMSIDQTGNMMEFFDPSSTDYPRMSMTELMRTSISNINDHMGWTGEYNLQEIDRALNKVSYQMYYDDYPVFNNYRMTDIVQEWRNQRLHRYDRPLFRLNNSLGSEQTEIMSGERLYYNLLDSSYNLENITDIRVGYELIYHDVDLNDYVTLKPSWFAKYNNTWQEIQFDTEDSPIQGGN